MHAPPIPLIGKRLLIAEDEFLLAIDMADTLELCGAQVVGPFGRLADAIAAARSETVDGAILDIDLAGERSFPIAEALAARGVPYLFASAFEGTAIPERHCGSPRLAKPFSEAALLAATCGLLGRAAAGAAPPPAPLA